MMSVAEYCIDQSMRLIARWLAAGKLRTVASGLENLPARGPALIVARHYHHLFDGLTLFAAIQRRFHIVVTLDWVPNRWKKFFMSSINRLARWPMILRGDACKHSGHERRRLFAPGDAARYQRRALRQAVELLAEERILVIFPEGYPNIDPIFTPKVDDEQFLPFKPGFLHILRAAEARLGAKVPIIPAGLRYQRGEIWVGYLRFGAPIFFDPNTPRHALIESIEVEVKRLSGIAANQ